MLVPAQGGKLLTVGHDGAAGDAGSEGLKALTLKAWAVEGLRSEATPPCSLTLKLFGSGKPPEGALTAVGGRAGGWGLREGGSGGRWAGGQVGEWCGWKEGGNGRWHVVEGCSECCLALERHIYCLSA